MSAFNNLAGKQYERLLVIKRTYDYVSPTGKHLVQWLCRCDCGKEIIVMAGSLRSGKTRSCGCLRRETLEKTKYATRLALGVAAFNKIYNEYRCSARKRDLHFSLTKEQFRHLTKGRCHYCNRSPSQIKLGNGKRGDYIYNGIDRVDNSKGYSVENCVPCCGRCNFAKGTATQTEFIQMCQEVVLYRT